MVSKAKHNVLLIGSGMMTPPLIDYLMGFGDTHITVASNLIKDAERLCIKYPKSMSASFLDVMDENSVKSVIKGHSLVISFIPPWMHMKVIPHCIDAGVNVCTSSYISPEMEALDAAAKAKGVIMVNECGLDPGIDIMGTMKVVHEAKKRNWKVVSYESYCGGLPAAEQANNPLGYKFSWNPGAGIRASRNTAIYMEKGKRVVCKEPLKVAKVDDNVSPAMQFEVYPNRDSTVFMKRFGMTDCETFIRGTFRFKGFSSIVSAFHDIGITSDDLCDPGVKTLRDLVEWRLTKVAEQKVTAGQKNIIAKLTTGMNARDQTLTVGVMARTDV